MRDTFTSFYNEFLRLAESGDEQAARKFLTDHILEFPEEVQRKIVFAFFEEALEATADAGDSLATLQQKGVEALQKIIKEEREIENLQHIGDLKKQLGIDSSPTDKS